MGQDRRQPSSTIDRLRRSVRPASGETLAATTRGKTPGRDGGTIHGPGGRTLPPLPPSPPLAVANLQGAPRGRRPKSGESTPAFLF